jgi:preprotein translocase subunit SecD
MRQFAPYTRWLCCAFVSFAMGCATLSQELVLDVAPEGDAALQAADVVRARVKGLVPPAWVTVEANRVRVLLPGDADADRVARLATAQGELRFHRVAEPAQTAAVLQAVEKAAPGSVMPHLEPAGSAAGLNVKKGYYRTIADAVAETGDAVPGGFVIGLESPGPDTPGRLYVLEAEPLMYGTGITGAAARPARGDPSSYAVTFEFEEAAAARFGGVTEANIGRALAIVLDDEVLMAPVIRSRITGHVMVSGAFTEREARDIAAMLQSGPLPPGVTVEVVSSGPVDTAEDE